MPQSPASPLLAAGALALAVTACGSAAMQPTTPSGTPSGVPEHERPNETQRDAKPPVPKRNPQAVPYEITLKIENAPGPFALVEASLYYDVDSPLCLPRLGGMSGTRVSARQSIPVELTRIEPDTYRGVVYDHLFLDEDYYSLGTCRWRFHGVGVSLRATGDRDETRFTEFLPRDEIVEARDTRTHFANLYYPRIDMPGYTAVGYRDVGRFRPEVRDALFSLHVIARRAPR